MSSKFLSDLLAIFVAWITGQTSQLAALIETLINDFGGVENVKLELAAISDEDLEQMAQAYQAEHLERCVAANPALGKIFPGDGSFIKALVALFTQLLPVILPLITPKTPPVPAPAN